MKTNDICTSDYEKERPMRIMVVNDDGIESRWDPQAWNGGRNG